MLEFFRRLHNSYQSREGTIANSAISPLCLRFFLVYHLITYIFYRFSLFVEIG